MLDLLDFSKPRRCHGQRSDQQLRYRL